MFLLESPAGRYALTSLQTQTLCQEHNATLATYDQMTMAQDAGYWNCLYKLCSKKDVWIYERCMTEGIFVLYKWYGIQIVTVFLLFVVACYHHYNTYNTILIIYIYFVYYAWISERLILGYRYRVCKNLIYIPCLCK